MHLLFVVFANQDRAQLTSPSRPVCATSSPETKPQGGGTMARRSPHAHQVQHHFILQFIIHFCLETDALPLLKLPDVDTDQPARGDEVTLILITGQQSLERLAKLTVSLQKKSCASRKGLSQHWSVALPAPCWSRATCHTGRYKS